jgi:hypothetical protein
MRIEGAVALIGAIALYATHSVNWLLFALLFFAPDLSALGYLLDKRQPQSPPKASRERGKSAATTGVIQCQSGLLPDPAGPTGNQYSFILHVFLL